MSLYTIQSGFNISDDLGYIYLGTGSARNNNTENLKNFIKTSFPKHEGRNNIYINSTGDLYNTQLINYTDCLVTTINIENGTIVKKLSSSSSSQAPSIDVGFINQLVDKKINELNININDKDLYKTRTEYNVIQYDQSRSIYYTFSEYPIEGNIIALIIITGEDDVEILSGINIIDRRVEFMSDFSVINMQARMTYLYKV
ncbi:MAG: hypothetical protein ACYDD5_00160 [Sulfuricurvum sp.]